MTETFVVCVLFYVYVTYMDIRGMQNQIFFLGPMHLNVKFNRKNVESIRSSKQKF